MLRQVVVRDLPSSIIRQVTLRYDLTEPSNASVKSGPFCCISTLTEEYTEVILKLSGII